MDLGLKNRVAVITGGASGIGRATAATFAGEGAHVAIWDLGGNALKVAERLSGKDAVKTLGIQVDVTDEAAVQRALRGPSSISVRSIMSCTLPLSARESSVFLSPISSPAIGRA